MTAFIEFTRKKADYRSTINTDDISRLEKDFADGEGCHLVDRFGIRIDCEESLRTMGARLSIATQSAR